MYSIGELSTMSQVTLRTLRYYDEIGLLKPAELRSGGRRFYNEDNLTTLEYILTLKELGFELNEIKNILEEREQGPEDLLNMRLSIIEDQMSQLNEAKKKIKTAIQLYRLGDYNDLKEIFTKIQFNQTSKNDISKAREKHFTPRERAVIEKLPKVGDDDPLAWKWSELLKDIKQAIEWEIPENSCEGVALVKRWNDLTLKIYDGDWKTAQKAWEIHMTKGENIGFADFNQKAVEYVQKAAYYYFAEGDHNK